MSQQNRSNPLNEPRISLSKTSIITTSQSKILVIKEEVSSREEKSFKTSSEVSGMRTFITAVSMTTTFDYVSGNVFHIRLQFV